MVVRVVLVATARRYRGFATVRDRVSIAAMSSAGTRGDNERVGRDRREGRERQWCQLSRVHSSHTRVGREPVNRSPSSSHAGRGSRPSVCRASLAARSDPQQQQATFPAADMNCFLLVQPRVPLSPRGVTVRLPSRAALSTGEREELSVTAERLLSRTLTVEVALETLRNAQQQEALRKASSLIDDVAARLRDDLDGAKRRLASLHGACHADGEPSSTGPLDSKFQSLVIGCALEDRRKLKKRLATLIRNVENADRAIKLLDHQYQKSSVSGTGTMTRR
ncbi:unnamed protein product [Lampetra fluviatilis]